MPALATSPHADPNALVPSAAQATAALVCCLRELADVLHFATDEQYVRNPVGVVSGSLGGHVRHCLDHFETLLRLVDEDEISYDHRERGTPVETDRRAAVARITELEEELAALTALPLDQPVRLDALLTAEGASLDAQSSVARELAFVLSHTVHHNAVIAAICRTLNIPLPPRFGYAPATSAYLARANG